MNSEKLPMDKAIEVLEFHCSSCISLSDVHGYFLHFDDAPSILVKIRLSFGSKFVFVSAEEDDSMTVRADDAFPDVLSHEVRLLNDVLPWEKAISRPLLWGWVMINQQGYFDGVQLDFSESVESDVTRIQILVVASELKIQNSGNS